MWAFYLFQVTQALPAMGKMAVTEIKVPREWQEFLVCLDPQVLQALLGSVSQPLAPCRASPAEPLTSASEVAMDPLKLCTLLLAPWVSLCTPHRVSSLSASTTLSPEPLRTKRGC